MGPQIHSRRVAVFEGASAPNADVFLEVCASEAGWEIQKLRAPEINAGALSKFDVAIFPGGSGSWQARELGPEGRDAVREFVEKGGGYLGVCGGAFLCSSHYSWSLGILNAGVLTSPPDASGDPRTGLWYRGPPSIVWVEFSEDGKALFGARASEQLPVTFHDGPVIMAGSLKAVTPFQPLAYYRSEALRDVSQRGTMMDTPAIVSGTFGAGRVIAIGPHFEQEFRNYPLLIKCLQWLSQRA